MERKVSVERNKPRPEGLNITPNDIFRSIKSYGDNMMAWAKFLDSEEPNASSNAHMFINMDRKRLHLLTRTSPEDIISTLNKIYADANSFKEQGLEMLDITTKIIRKYGSIYDYADLFWEIRNGLLQHIAEISPIARDKEWYRLEKTYFNCEIALTLEDYNAIDKEAPQKLKKNPGKTMLEMMEDEEILLYIKNLKRDYDFAKQAKSKAIDEHGQEEYDEDIKKEGIFWHTIQIWIDSYLETMKYIKSRGKLPVKAFKT